MDNKYKLNSNLFKCDPNFFLKKIGACVFWAPVFFLSFLAGKLKIFKQVTLMSIKTSIR